MYSILFARSIHGTVYGTYTVRTCIRTKTVKTFCAQYIIACAFCIKNKSRSSNNSVAKKKVHLYPGGRGGSTLIVTFSTNIRTRIEGSTMDQTSNSQSIQYHVLLLSLALVPPLSPAAYQALKTCHFYGR